MKEIFESESKQQVFAIFTITATSTSMMTYHGISTFSLIFLFLILLTSSEVSADACDLTMDGTLGSMRGWFWSSPSASSCSKQSDCVKTVECCLEGKCTWADWVAPLIFTLLLLFGVTFLMCFISCCPGNIFKCACDCSGRKSKGTGHASKV